jgi:hypothetical protein
MARVTTRVEPTVTVNVELKRLQDLCSDLDRALVFNKAEREQLERLRARAEHTLRELRQQQALPEV